MKNISQDITTQCFNEHDIQKLIKLIASGKAILFTGAGFSSEAINIEDSELPTGKILADKIDNITGEQSHQDLLVAAENAIDNDMEDELIELIKNTFTVKQILPYQKTIVSLPWRRYYTTNYDSVIKDAGLQNNKRIKCITTSESVTDNLKEKELCIHINGYLEDLNKGTLNTSFKLTDSSYLHNDALNDTPWVDVFQRDITHVSAIVFMGYSLYDYNIKSLLFNRRDELKDKTYFITREKPCDKTKTEQKYGKVINIGVKHFADYVNDNQEIIDEFSKAGDTVYESFKIYTISDNLSDISHDMIRDFLIYGKYNKNYIDQAIQNAQNNRHIIVPTWIDQSLDLMKENNYVHITGDLGTGKSVGMQLVACKLANEGENVYIFNDKYGDYVGDLEKISENYKKNVYLLIDNAEENRDVIQHVYSLNNPKIRCTTFSRKNMASVLENQSNLQTKIFSLDKMKDSDVGQLIEIVENIGISGDYSSKGLRLFIEQECEYSLPNFLLQFLKSDIISALIKEHFKKLANHDNSKYRDTIIALCLLGVLNRQLSFSTIATLTNNNNIRNSELLDHPVFKTFFISNYGQIAVKSPIFAVHILQNHYMDSIKKEVFIKFAKIANENKNIENLNDKALNFEYEKIFKELVKFVSLSRLFTKDNYDIILSYFEQLKLELNWLKNDPNYWLQLAILNMARNRFEVAEEEISTARKTATKKSEYHFDYIDTVEARYKLDLSLKSSTNILKCYDLFFEADDLLKNVEASDQKYRRVFQYYDVFRKINNSVSKDKLKVFLQRIQFQIDRIQELEHENFPGIDRIHFVYNCEANLKKIISEANK